jgi:hypothetical protein
VNNCGIPDTNFGNKGGADKTMISVPLFDLTFRIRMREASAGNIKSAALGTERKQTLAGLSNPK